MARLIDLGGLPGAHEESSYMGCLLFDDEIFFGQITKLLEAHCNRHIAEIGCIDLSHTL